jgi:hypothetical protein
MDNFWKNYRSNLDASTSLRNSPFPIREDLIDIHPTNLKAMSQQLSEFKIIFERALVGRVADVGWLSGSTGRTMITSPQKGG